MNLRRAWAVARKESLHILRDPRSLVLALAVPVVMLLLFGYALTLDVDRIPTLVLDRDNTPESRELIAQFRGSRYFEIVGTAGEYGAIERAIDRGQCLLGLVIPVDYSRDLLRRHTVEVQALLDGSDSNTASIALGYVDALLRAHAAGIRLKALDRLGTGKIDPPVEARLRVWYNEELKSKNYVVPGLIAVILMIIAALLTSLTIAREWEMGTMEQLLSTPLRPAELLLGKLSAYFALGLADTLIAMALGVFLFEVPLRGNPFFLLVTSCIFLFGALCWGILISALARTQLLAFQLGMLTSFLPAFLLSGFVYSIENMPPVIQLVSRIFPTRYFITALKGIFLKGAGLEVLWLEIVFLVIYAAVIFLLAVRRLRGKLA